MRRVCLFVLMCVCSASLTPAQNTAKRKILMMAGNPSHGYGAHEHYAGLKILQESIEASSAAVDVTVIKGWPEDESIVDEADAIVIYCDGGKRHLAMNHRAKLREVLNKGCGFVCIHYAVEMVPGQPGADWVEFLGGHFEIDYSVNPHWVGNFDSLPEHAVTRGVQPFATNDEWYFHLRFSDQGTVTPILAAVAPETTMVRKDGAHSGNPHVRKSVARGEKQTVAWTYDRPDGGRSFGFTGGHYHWNWGNDDVRRLVTNAIRWTAGDEIEPAGSSLGKDSVNIDALLENQDYDAPKNFSPADKAKEFNLTTTETEANVTTTPGDSQRAAVNALAGIELGDGLAATLSASEPVLRSLTNLDIDDRGRVWVCDVMNYRKNAGSRPEGDRILILEDTTGDGVMDKVKTFYQGSDIDSAMGICVLGNQVIVTASPTVWRFTDADGDDVPDSKEAMFTETGQPQHDHSAHSFLFGPDGKLYWNFGNTGKQVKDSDGQTVIDIHGRPIVDDGSPLYGGMPFRCDLDGSNFEVLAHNFRNNWETTVDSFGTLWQSDNDDDGNRGTRINFVMEQGNYGYRDELTGAGWREDRITMEDEVPLRHWHLNDPGVVPNMLQTGAGSPSGICMYEGRLLPKRFWDQVIHCDPGPNVVRAYPAQPDGAGYSASIDPLMTGTGDMWFRPADVCVAPDGSVFVTDWYDPGVGGHHQKDLDRGRLFRIAPPGTKYSVPKFDYSTVDGSIEALKNPNLSVRFNAWTALKQFGSKAEKGLQDLLQDENPRLAARALWLLGKIDGRGRHYVDVALAHPNSDIRVTGIRLSKQLGLVPSVACATAAHDSSAAVRRELAVALRFDESAGMPATWAKLAMTYDGKDRWFLEALGIGSDLRAAECLDAWLAESGQNWQTPAGRDLVWRVRASKAAKLICEVIADESLTTEQTNRYFRSLEYHDPEIRTEALRLLIDRPASPRQDAIVIRSIERMVGFDAAKDPAASAAIARHIARKVGTPEYLSLVKRFKIEGAATEVEKMLMTSEDMSTAVAAAEYLCNTPEGPKRLRELLKLKDPQAAAYVARVLGLAGNGRTNRMLSDTAADTEQPYDVRSVAVRGLAKNNLGQNLLLDLAAAKKLPGDTRLLAGGLLSQSRQEPTRKRAAELLPQPKQADHAPLPPLDKLVKQKGQIANGIKVFRGVATCANCHVVGEFGKEVGPNLSEIGSKLSREAMFASILDPSGGVSHNYENYIALLDSGQVITGVKVTETDQHLVLRTAEAIDRKIPQDEIEDLKKSEKSIMPENLHHTTDQQGLVDMVEYLMSLKKK